MADDLDLSLSGYAKLERGEIDITISRINQIASLLGIDVSQLLNFDASQIFNLNNNKLVQGVGTKANTVHYHTDEYLVKYVKVLEQEIERLKSENKYTWVIQANNSINNALSDINLKTPNSKFGGTN